METAEELALSHIHVSANGHSNGALQNADRFEFGVKVHWGSISSALSQRQRIVKRALDLVVTLPLFVLLLPVLLVLAVAVYLESEGPILVRQTRIGERGTLFAMLKFRTMYRDSEKRARQVKIGFPDRRKAFKTREDPRVTRVGRFLRRTSLDELPQLLNVLVGHMSLVGPRPELFSIAMEYESWQWGRWSVPQGLTGLWQIRGRSNRPTKVKCLDDLEYVRDYSFWLDIKILLRTILPVVRGSGAY